MQYNFAFQFLFPLANISTYFLLNYLSIADTHLFKLLLHNSRGHQSRLHPLCLRSFSRAFVKFSCDQTYSDPKSILHFSHRHHLSGPSSRCSLLLQLSSHVFQYALCHHKTEPLRWPSLWTSIPGGFQKYAVIVKMQSQNEDLVKIKERRSKKPPVYVTGSVLSYSCA